MAVTVKENGGLRALISALDRWAAEVVTRRNDELFAGSSNVLEVTKLIASMVTCVTKQLNMFSDIGMESIGSGIPSPIR
ncbi:hypothetical protein CEXT_663621 [Caerostris extrusa]|uniref:Uncharacterized protein n=1 Tax=Caerostris extrusa TaxID=172846 RepID=A0AAV4X271_CAEEX|nr:hypothetical protein CEXT_663621 [Caerostris extrusa]